MSDETAPTNLEGHDSIPRDVGKLWGTVREIKAWAEGKVREVELILIGIDGTNGLRGDLRATTKRVDELADRIESAEDSVREALQWGKDLWYIKRKEPGECLGVVAAGELERRLAAAAEHRERELVELKKARLAMYGAILVALITVSGTLASSYLTFKAATTRVVTAQGSAQK